MGAKYKKGSYVKDLKTIRIVKIINVFESKNQNNGYEWHQDTKSLVKFFKPFDKVLVRDDNECVWKADFYSHYKGDINFCYVCIGDAYRQCIPYNEETAHLVNTDHNCPDKYKIWKDEL